MKRIIALLALATVSFTLAGCFTPSNKDSNNNTNAVKNQIEGQWVDNRGIISSFNKGVFVTRTSDTNEKLAEGNYVKRSPKLIEIEMRSLLRGTVSRVNCVLNNGGLQLGCTTTDGNRFTLNRRNVNPVTTASASQ